MFPENSIIWKKLNIITELDIIKFISENRERIRYYLIYFWKL